MKVYYNSRDEFYKKPFGAVKTGTTVMFRLRISERIKGIKCSIAMWAQDVKLPDVEMEKEKEDENGDIIFFAKYKAPNEETVLWYHFVIESYDEKFYYSNNDLQSGGVGLLVENSPKSFQLTIYKSDIAPNWFKEGIAYQIFPDRFCRGKDYEDRKNGTFKRLEGKNHGKRVIDDWNITPNYEKDGNGDVLTYDFYGGTLQGIEEKLSYLKSLGVSIIYLNPIFEARSNHRYDTGDYMRVDSLLGDEESLKSLINAAKKVGIGIVLDGVFSHQGADSIYFNKYNTYDGLGAYNSKESPYYDWYNFSSWPNEYDCWWGVKDLPNVNEMNNNYLDYICRDKNSVIKHWMKQGIAGFRLDVADELPDEFIEEIRIAMDKVNKDNILIGEVWEDATNKVSYNKNRKYFINATLKSVMNYPFMENAIAFMSGKKSPYELSEFLCQQMENYPPEYYSCNFNIIDSHDKTRILTILSDSNDETTLDENSKRNFKIDRDKYLLAVSRLKALTILQYTIPGIPVIYYGDEVGLYGYSDPYNRKTYPWGNEDKALLSHYEVIGKMRVSSDAIKKGDFKILYYGKHTIVYERNYRDEKVVVIINRGIFQDEGEHIEINLKGKIAKSLIGNEEININDDKLIVDVLPLGYKVLQIR